MQVINVKYQDGVFVPAEPVKMTQDQEAVVIISEGKSEKSIPRDKERMKKAFTEYKTKYPEDDVSLDDFRYVGIVPGIGVKDSKDELIDAIETKLAI